MTILTAGSSDKPKLMKSKEVADFGNTVDFAYEKLAVHWIKVHNRKPGNSKRPVDCMECRGLWLRASATHNRDLAVPIRYVELAKMVIHWSKTVVGLERIRAAALRK